MSINEEKIGKIKEARKKWEDGVLKKNMQKFGLQESPIAICTPADLEGHDFLEHVGFPGEFPFTAGRYPIPVMNLMWGRGKTYGAGKTVKQVFGYAGYGTAEDMRDYYFEIGGTGYTRGGPNLAFDLPTQIGYDSDHGLSQGEVGRVGVAIDSLKDFEILYEAFTGDKDIDKVSSNWTINGTTNILLAFYIALAEKRGIPMDKLSGTPQNDILKEFVARGTQAFPVGPSMRMTRDTITFCTKNMPKMNTITIAGYHMREAGASRIQAIAFTMADAIAYFQTVIDAGLAIDEFYGKTTFLNFGGGMEVLKEVAVRRAARRVWAHIMRDRFGSKNPSHWIYREPGGVLVGYWTSTKERPLNNLVRAAIGAAFSAMIGDPPLVAPPYDEALGLGHSLESWQLSADAARIIAEECKLCDAPDVFAGSYYVESLTERYYQEINELIVKIDEMGGAAKAVESGWMKNEITKYATEYYQKLEAGEEIVVGVNKYTEPDEISILPPRTSPYKKERREDAEGRQIDALQKLRKERDNRKVQACLEKIENAAKDEKANLIPYFVEAAREYATMGEMCGALKNVFGEAK
jgi:methylmalonyl-CoA mutase N-terminal domain/subunit